MFSPAVDDALPPPLPTQEAAALRAALCDSLPAAKNMALLELGQQCSRLLISEGCDGHPHPVYHHLQLGIETLVTRTFKRAMPSEARLEQGIMEVEEAVMPMTHLLPAHSWLYTCDPKLLAVAQVALGWPEVSGDWSTYSPPPTLSIDAVEALFDQLARQSTRPHLPLGGLPQEPEWAAALLILRESLHHWQLEGVRLLPNCTPPAHFPKG